ncbi:MAG: SIR2 family protein [Phycisphaeraceae bacterium]|nr:SIR2 family protein [Phycisphaeraceae bacterium]
MPEPLGSKDASDVQANEEAYSRLLGALAARPNVVVGAGTSAAVGYPLWRPLIQRLAQAVRTKRSEQSPHLDGILAQRDALWQAQKLRELLGEELYWSELRSAFTGSDDRFTKLHTTLLSLPFRHVLTTNYDRVFERAAGSHPFFAFDFDEGTALGQFLDGWSKPDNPRHIVHVHGSIERPSGIVLTLADYRARYQQANWATEALKQLFAFDTVFIGFSLDDEDVMAAFDYFSALFGQAEPKHFAILAEPSDGHSAVLRTRLRDRFRVEPVFYASTPDHAALPVLIEKLYIDASKAPSRRPGASATELVTATVQLVLADEPERLAQTLSRVAEIAEQAGRMAEALPALLPSAVETAEVIEAKGPIDEEIDAAFAFVERGQADVTLELLERVLTREGPALSERLRYRVLANIGNALYAMGKRRDAATKYLEAVPLRPNDRNARGLEVLAYFLLEDDAKAHELASVLCDTEPTFGRAHALRLRTMAPGQDFTVAESSVPEPLRRDPEVAAALSDIARDSGRLDDQERYAREALGASPNWTDAMNLLGCALFMRARAAGVIDVEHGIVATDPQPLVEAEDLFTRALAKEPAGTANPLFAGPYFNRASVRKSLGKYDEATADLHEAFRRGRDEREIVFGYALSRSKEGDLDAAISAISGLRSAASDAQACLLNAEFLLERGRPEDREIAIAGLRPFVERLDTVEPVTQRPDFVAVLAALLRAAGDESALESVLGLVPAGALDTLQVQLLKAEDALRRTARSDAQELTREVLGSLRPESDWFLRRGAASIAERAGLFREAFDLWRSLIPPRFFNIDSASLLRCAYRLGEHRFILDFCRALREHGVHERSAYEIEIDTLVHYRERAPALTLLNDWLAAHPNDIVMRVRRCLIAVERGDETSLAADVPHLPGPLEVSDGHLGNNVVYILRHVQKPEQVVEYAYELSRRFPDSEPAQYALVASVLAPLRGELRLAQPAVVDESSAVLLRREDRATAEWISVESGPNASPAQGEFRRSHPLVAAIVGKGVGDRVSVGEHTYTIDAIESRVAHRVRTVLAKFSEWFPNQRAFREFKVATPIPDNTDAREALGDVWKLLKQEEDQRKALEGFYQEGPVPISTFARYVGRSVIETVGHLARQPHLGIRCAFGGAGEWAAATKEVREAEAVVLDSTAVATLHLLGIHDRLPALPFRCVVPDSVIQEVRNLVRDLSSGPQPSGYLAAVDGRPVLQEFSAERQSLWIRSLEGLVASLLASGDVVGGSSLLELPEGQRDRLPKMVGAGVADAIAVARARGIPLWSDDLTVSVLAQNEWGIRRVWSQAVFAVSAEVNPNGMFDPQSIAIGLFELNYFFTRLGVAELTRILREVGWNAKHVRARRAIEYVWAHGPTHPVNWQISIRLLWAIWRTCPKPESAERVIGTLLDGMPRGVAVVVAKAIYRAHLPQRMLANVDPADAAALRRLRRVLRRWRGRHPASALPTRRGRAARRA